MKKVFTLMMMLLAMTFFAKAQTLLSEDFEGTALPAGWTVTDADGDGFNWELNSTFPTHSGTQMMSSQSFDSDAGALTPDNYLITPQITIPAQGAILTFWVCGQDASYVGEHYGVFISTTGTAPSDFSLLYEETLADARVQGIWHQKTVNITTAGNVYIAFRHYNVTDMFYLNLDDVSVMAIPTSPTIIADPTTVDFGTVLLGGTVTPKTVAVTTYNLTAGVTATTTAPFEVSSDGTTYGTTATLATAGGTFYVKYSSAAVGSYTGSLNLASTGATTVSVPLTGGVIVCNTITALPYSCDFSLNNAEYNCWTVVDANNDGTINADGYYDGKFNFMQLVEGNDGTAVYLVPAAGDTVPANDWLISPTINVTENYYASFDYMVGYEIYWFWQIPHPETFSVWVIPENGTYANAVNVLPARTVNNYEDFETITFDMSAYAGQEVKLAIKVETPTEESAFFAVDNFVLNTLPASSVTINPDSLTFERIPSGMFSSSQEVNLTAWSLGDDLTITAPANFEISADNVTFDTVLTIPQSNYLNSSIFVRFAPLSSDIFSGDVVFNSGTVTTLLNVSGEASNCPTIATFPYNEGFEADSGVAPICWFQEMIVGTNPWIFTAGVNSTSTSLAYASAAHSGNYNAAFVYSGDGPITKLITPTFDLSALSTANLKFYFAAKAWAGDQDTLNVFYRTAPTAAWTLLTSLGNDEGSYVPVVLTLPNLTATYQLAFEGNANYGYGIVIDDIQIYEPVMVNVTGTVTSGSTPVQGVDITFTGDQTYTTVSDLTGNYTLTCEAGTYNVTATKVGYNNFSQTGFTVSAGMSAYNIALTAPCFSITPSSLSVTTNYRVDGTATATITNCGNGAMNWSSLVDYVVATPSHNSGISYDEFLALAGNNLRDASQEANSYGIAPERNPAYLYNSLDRSATSNAIIATTGTALGHFTLNDPANITSFGVTFPEFTNSADYINGTYYAVSSTSGNLMTLNSSTGAFTQIATGNQSGSISYNPTDGVTYGLKLGSTPVLYSINLSTGAETQVLALNTTDFILGMTITNDGRFLLIDAGVDGISELNPLTGDVTPLIVSGFTVNYGQDMAMDRETNTPYWAAFNADASSAQLYAVDLTNNSLSLIGSFANQSSCFAIETNAVLGWLSLSPANGSIASGATQTVTFTMDGWWAPSGSFSALVNFNTDPSVDVNAFPVNFTINAATCDNPTNLVGTVVNYDYVALTWNAPANTTGLTGYNIYRDEAHTPIATVSATTTSYNDNGLEVGTYCYVVSAVFGDCVSSGTENTCVTKTWELASLTGTVVDSATHAPIANANIEFVGSENYNATTDAAGTFMLMDVRVGAYAVTASANGYEQFVNAYTIASGANIMNITMLKTPCAVVPQNLTAVQSTGDDNNITLSWASSDVTIELEAHNVWGDNSGYQLYLDADATAYGNEIPETGALTTSGNVPASVMSVFEYFVPANADGSLTTTNMIFDGVGSNDIPAGTYDYVVTNPTPNDRMWIAAGADSRGDNYVFESGFTYHFLVDRNGNNDQTTLSVIRSERSNNTFNVYRDGNMIASGLTSKQYVDASVPAGSYCYTVAAVCSNGEISTMSEPACITVTGIDNYDNSSIEIYPNPATDIVTVSATHDIQQLEILNYLGQVVYVDNANNNVFTVNVKNYADGVYFIRLTSDKGVSTRKFIKK